MTADAIAKVVDDIRNQRVRSLVDVDPDLFGSALRASGQGPIVDCSAIYRSLLAKDEPVYLYEDHPSIAPPWDDACYAYVNQHGNAVVMSSRARPFDMSKIKAVPGLEPTSDAGQPWKPGNEVDWEDVRWIVNNFVWLGGKSSTRGDLPTSGPAHMWQFAIYESGAPADLHWIHLMPGHPLETWDMAQMVLLGALNFLNCRNVTIGEPVRPRAQRRRLERMGIQVHEILITALGRSTRSGRNEEPGATPLTSVRGHFAEYGPRYEKGLLFGKLEGRFWIPQHARGASEFGESEHNYRLVQS